LNPDPRSASNRNPLERRVLAVALAPSELAGVAETARASRYDATGLKWLLCGRAVVALTATEAAIQGATGVLLYRKLRKLARGPVGDSLDDWGAS
jgi:hypothetical protein